MEPYFKVSIFIELRFKECVEVIFIEFTDIYY